MNIRRWRHPDVQSHFLAWLQGFAELADGLVTLLSFGFLMSNFEIRYCWWRTGRKFQEGKKTP